MSEQKISVFLDFFSVAIILGISSNLDSLSMLAFVIFCSFLKMNFPF